MESRFRLYESDFKCSEIQGRGKLEKLEMSEMLHENGAQHQALKRRLEFDWMEGTGNGSSKCVTSKKGTQQESCELSFIWGKMRTAAQETAPRMALRPLQRGSGGRPVQKILVKGEFSAIKHSFYKSLMLITRR